MRITGASKAAARRAGMSLTARQLFIGMARAGHISADEAVAAAQTGAMPAAVAAAVEGLDAAAQIEARITWARLAVIERLDPLVDLMAAGRSPEEIDAFFETYSAI